MGGDVHKPNYCSTGYIPFVGYLHVTVYFIHGPIPLDFIGLYLKYQNHCSSGYITHITRGLYHVPNILLFLGLHFNQRHHIVRSLLKLCEDVRIPKGCYNGLLGLNFMHQRHIDRIPMQITEYTGWKIPVKIMVRYVYDQILFSCFSKTILFHMSCVLSISRITCKTIVDNILSQCYTSFVGLKGNP